MLGLVAVLLVAAPQSGGAVLFSDDFNRTTGLGSAWRVVAGLWRTPGTRAESDLNAGDRASVQSLSCADCEVQARVVNFAAGFVALDLRLVASGDRYDVALLGNGHLQIRRHNGTAVTVLGDAPSGIADLRNWAAIALSATGAGPVQLVASVNGVARVAATDSSTSAIVAPGTAGMSTSLAGIWFDDFVVSDASSAGVPDAGTPDAGVPDAGPPDAGPPEGGTPDAGTPDAGTPPPQSGVLFSDDFNRTSASDLGPRWNIVAGGWRDNGKANSDRTALDRATAAGVSCTECRIDSKMVNFAGGEAMLELRVSGADRYVLALTTAGKLEIRRYRGGLLSVLGSVASGIADLGAWHSFTFTGTGSGPVTLTAAVDGVLKLSASDASPQALTAAGEAGIAATVSGILFDDFVLSGAGSSGSVPPPDAGTPDAGTPDAGAPDAGPPDAGPPDAGTPDAGTPDAGTADAGTPPPQTGVLFSDDFNRTLTSGLGPKWSILAGAWRDNDKANSDLRALDRAVAAGVTCADCRIDAKMVNFAGGEAMLELRGAGSDRYALVLTVAGSLEIRRYRAGVATVLGSAASGIPDLGAWHSFTFSAQGAGPVTLVGSVDGVPKLSSIDASASALTASGAAGIAATVAGILFDDFVLNGSVGPPPPPPPPGSSDWPVYRHDLSGTGRASGTLTLAQARNLTPGFTAAIPYGSAANPLVVGGTLYVVAGGGQLMALDAKTGALQWQQPIGSSSKGPCVSWTQGPIGAAAVAGNTIYAPGGNGTVYAFNKDTGAPLWATSVADTTADDFLWSSMFPVDGKVYIGVATLVETTCGEMPGRFVSLDGASGATLGTWWADKDHGHGGGVWTSPAYDPVTKRIFVTTGTVADGADPLTKPWQQAFVAVDPDTMQTLDSYQPVSTSFSTDYDFGTSPVLFDLADGRHLIAATNKNGFVYALDRDNLAAGVLWKTEISAPGASPDLGESAISSPVYANGMVFVAGGQTTDGYAGAIEALDPATGSILWKIHPDGFVLPAMAAVDGVLFAGVSHAADKTGKLYVLDQRTGEVLFTFSTKGRLFAQPSWSNGMLYFVDDLATLYTLKP